MIVNHPHLEALAVKARQARDVAAASTKVDKEVSGEIKDIMAELGGSEVIVGGLKVSLSETKRENSKLFKELLLKAGVNPAILEAATEASKTSSSTLRITAATQEEDLAPMATLAPMAQMEGASYY